MSKKNMIMFVDGMRMTKNRMTALRDTINEIRDVIDVAEKLKYAYFWRPPQTASVRRWQEKLNRAEAIWSESGHEYSASIGCSMSCRNVYVDRMYLKDGYGTNLTAIKSSLKRLEKMYSDAVERAEKRK